MSLDEMRRHEWIVPYSGGKDSTATIILMHENKISIKKIIYVQLMYNDVIPATLPIMYNYVVSSQRVFNSWGYSFEILKGYRTAYDMAIQKYFRSKKHADRNGCYYGISAFTRGFCRFQAVKPKTIDNYFKNSSDYRMIGYTCNEFSRLHRLGGNKQSILCTLGLTSKDAFKICENYGLLSPIYKTKIRRDGCFFCPNACAEERRQLKTDYPQLYACVEELIKLSESGYNLDHLYSRNNWIREYYDNIDVTKQLTFDSFKNYTTV